MQQIIVRSPGSYSKLQCEEVASPSAPAGSALVRTASIGVNFADVIVRLGLYPSAKELVGWPITPGFEFSGVIEELSEGENPRGLAVGDRVVGVVAFGAYSALVSAPLTQLFRVPDELSLLEAGVLPVAGLTALYALEVLGAAGPGKKVLIHSAAGGVGMVMVQMAKLLGCSLVVGVVGATNKVAHVEALGADAVIDKSREDLFERSRELALGGFDLVLDANGAETLAGSYKALRPTGRLIIFGVTAMLGRNAGRPNWFKLIWDFLRTPRFSPLDMINANKSVMAFNLSYLFGEQKLLQDSMERILRWYAEGAIRMPPIEQFTLRDAPAAHRLLQSGKTVGKLTLVPEQRQVP